LLLLLLLLLLLSQFLSVDDCRFYKADGSEAALTTLVCMLTHLEGANCMMPTAWCQLHDANCMMPTA
jgi:hypothetical protein